MFNKERATFPYNNTGNITHHVVPNVHASCIYLDATKGKLTQQNNKSEMQRESTNAVVACILNFGHRIRANMVIKLPEI